MKHFIMTISICAILICGCEKNPTEPVTERQMPQIQILMSSLSPHENLSNAAVLQYKFVLRDSLDIPVSSSVFPNTETTNLFYPFLTFLTRNSVQYNYDVNSISPKIESVTIINKWSFTSDSLVTVVQIIY